MYWKTKPDCRNSLVGAAMIGSYFDDILKYLYLADNEKLERYNKFGYYI
jgi:hypothetical protein